MSSDEANLPGALPSLDLSNPGSSRRAARIAALSLLLLVVVAAAAFIFGRIYFARAMRANLRQLDGTQVAYGLMAPVTVARDTHGVPHIHAQDMDDLVFAQGYITAQDRLWQMDMLRRNAAGELAAVLGSSVVPQDIAQRTLQLRAVADRAAAALPADQRRWLTDYARGVNASIVEQHAHLPIEFRMLGYTPAAWSPRDSILVELSMYEELTSTFQQKLVREALSAHL
ncbi:MAG TPA: penicillin acylase family protein, partial [Acidobacteriaceae bacterium]